MISGKDWLVQHNTHLDFQFECCMFYKGHCEVTMQMNLVQTQSNPQTHCHAIQTVNSEGQLTMVGDEIEDIMAPPYATMLKEFVDVFQPLPIGLPLE